MKIVLTGGGTGGHFYPIIAVAERINQIIDEEKIVGTKLYYISDNPYDKEALFQNGLLYEEVKTGKRRLYFSFQNFFDLFKIGIAIINALFKLFIIYPDVVFGKGGYASFPTVFAAKILRIPVFIHESDSSPGRVNKWAGKFAKRVALSFSEASDFFPNKNTALVGHPIRMEIEHKAEKTESLSYFKLESEIPVILILGGSQGAEIINNTILEALPKLLKDFQIIHQTGINNFKSVVDQADIINKENPHKSRYISVAFLNSFSLKMAAGAATLIVSRAGSTLFEIAAWGVPSILIPFTNSNGDHSRKNAFNYSRVGACEVMEENNLTANILTSEIYRIIKDKDILGKMSLSAKNFHKSDGAYKIAKEIINIALSHEK